MRLFWNLYALMQGTILLNKPHSYESRTTKQPKPGTSNENLFTGYVQRRLWLKAFVSEVTLV